MAEKSVDTKSISELRVADLRSQLEGRGLDTDGLKGELIERLGKAIDEELLQQNSAPSETIELSNATRNVTKKLSLIEKRFGEEFDELRREITKLKYRDEFHTTLSREYVDRIQNENDKLNADNRDLRERTENLSYIMSDLNTKVKDLENEKLSLVTVIKILQSEDSRGNNINQHDGEGWINVKDKGHANMAVQSSQNFETSNRFDVLSVNSDDTTPNMDQEQDQTMGIKTATNKVSNNDREGGRGKPSNKSKNTAKGPETIETKGKATGKTTVIIGDSLTKHLDARRLKRSIKKGNQKLYVETYSGANTDAIKHHMRPSLARKPDKIIMHVGTNDLKDKDVTQTVKSIESTCQIINSESPTTKVAISELICRNDKQENADKVIKVNKQIAKLCLKHRWDHIKHENITATQLNPYGIHLNKSGTSLLAKNYIEYINSNSKDD